MGQVLIITKNNEKINAKKKGLSKISKTKKKNDIITHGKTAQFVEI